MNENIGEIGDRCGNTSNQHGISGRNISDCGFGRTPQMCTNLWDMGIFFKSAGSSLNIFISLFHKKYYSYQCYHHHVIIIYQYGRFGKSTLISMISKSVTHLRSYKNSAIAGNSARSQTSPRIERRYRRIEWPLRDRRRRCPKRRRLHIERRYRRVEWGVFECFMMFHNVLRVSWCFTSNSHCFTCVSWCLTMFYDV